MLLCLKSCGSYGFEPIQLKPMWVTQWRRAGPILVRKSKRISVLRKYSLLILSEYLDTPRSMSLQR